MVTFSLEQKDHIKYLGVTIDEKINWKHHISFVCSSNARNTGILFKLPHYLSPLQLRQLYYNRIYSYISYKTSLKSSNLNKIILPGLSFLGPCMEKIQKSALPLQLLNLLDILTAENSFKVCTQLESKKPSIYHFYRLFHLCPS